jgi:hypothetical protein
MKITKLITGILFAAGSLLIAAPTKDVQISAPARNDSSSLPDKRGDSSPAPPAVGGLRRGELEDAVEILGVTEGKPEADGRRKVTVRVRYVLVHYPQGILCLGFNLKSATKFVQLINQPVMAGAEEKTLTATIVPVTWPDAQPFKLYVSLSAEPRAGHWSLLSAKTQVLKPTVAPAAAH